MYLRKKLIIHPGGRLIQTAWRYYIKPKMTASKSGRRRRLDRSMANKADGAERRQINMAPRLPGDLSTGKVICTQSARLSYTALPLPVSMCVYAGGKQSLIMLTFRH